MCTIWPLNPPQFSLMSVFHVSNDGFKALHVAHGPRLISNGEPKGIQPFSVSRVVPSDPTVRQRAGSGGKGRGDEKRTNGKDGEGIKAEVRAKRREGYPVEDGISKKERKKEKIMA